MRKGKISMVREVEIENYLVKQVKYLEGLAIKLSSNYENGMPDRMVLFPGKLVWFVELKKPGEKPRALQRWMHKQLEQFGHEVLVFDNKDDIDKWLGGLKNGKEEKP